MCQFSSCHLYGEGNRNLFRQLSPKATAAVQGGWWADHLSNSNNAHLVSTPYHSDSGTYSGHNPSLSSHFGSTEESIPGYSYGYGTNF